jgi:hypothetical protein
VEQLKLSKEEYSKLLSWFAVQEESQVDWCRFVYKMAEGYPTEVDSEHVFDIETLASLSFKSKKQLEKELASEFDATLSANKQAYEDAETQNSDSLSGGMAPSTLGSTVVISI